MYAGNAVIANLFMRWPVLIPGAAVAGGVILAQPTEAPPPPEPAPIVAPAPAPEPTPELKLTPELVVPPKVEVPPPLPPKKKING